MDNARRVLDRVQHLRDLERFDPATFTAAAEAELPAAAGGLAELQAQLDGLRSLLAEVDRFTEKVMRVRILHAGETLPQQLRTLIASTIVSYDGKLELFRQRLGGAIARHGGAEAAERLMEAARDALDTRARLRGGVFTLAGRLAASWQPLADRAARDRSQPDEQRERWRRARVDLAQIAARGDTLDAGGFDERLARITGEEPPEEEQPHRFSLLELD
jgi:hypothetical protein